MRNLSVIGTGYVGLVTGTCLADFGNKVICLDIDEDKINGLSNGVMPIFEPGLEELVKRNIAQGRLEFTTSLEKGIKKSEVIFIAVGTPPKPDGGVDLSQILTVAREIATHINGYKIIVNKSTVPAGTGAKVERLINENMTYKFEFDVVSNPEFLREGSAIEDFMKPDRVVVGSVSRRALDLMSEIYSPLDLQEIPIIKTNVESAEMIKYASNAFLSTKISFINEIANLCEHLGADIKIVAKGMGLDSRIGHQFLNAGIGFGGSCFPKDTEGIMEIAEKCGYDLKIVRSAIAVNDIQKTRIVDKLKKFLGDLSGRRIGILGLSFKPNTDDIREAPSIEIIRELLAENVEIRAFDPIAIDNMKEVFPELVYASDAYDASKGCDALLIITEWNQFRDLDLVKIKKNMSTPIIIDGRNLYDPKKVKQLGFLYDGIGRGGRLN